MFPAKKIFSFTLVLACAVSTVHAQSRWTWRNPLPQGNNLHGVTRMDSLWVAVGEERTVLTSRDGVSWTRGTQEPPDLELVASNGPRVVAMGSGGVTAFSDNGIHWKVGNVGASPEASSFWPGALVWSGSMWVATGGFRPPDYEGGWDLGAVLVSSDGVNWTWLEHPFSLVYGCHAAALVRIPEGLMLAWKDQVSFSTDGLTWSAPKTIAGMKGRAFSEARWMGNRFEAVAVDEMGYYEYDLPEDYEPLPDLQLVSKDGLVWDSVPQTLQGAQAWRGAQGNLGTFPGTVSAVQRSSGPDSQWVAVGSMGLLLHSFDGTTWISNDDGSRAFNFEAVTWTGRAFIALADSGFVHSPDGISWTFTRDRAARGLRHLTWTGTRLVAVGDSGLIRTSLDGAQWYTRPSGTRDGLRAVRWWGQGLVAVGTRGAIVVSTDGADWSYVRSGSFDDLNAVVWTGSRLVAVGENGIVVTSRDGKTWLTFRKSPLASQQSVVWTGKNLFTAGRDGTAASTDGGVTWELREARQEYGSSLNFSRMVWAGDQFVALGGYRGQEHRIYVSPDARDWKPVFRTSARLRGLLWTEKRLVVVGNGGLILTSP